MQSITLQKFQEICERAGFASGPEGECSPELHLALHKASEGDFSHFDQIDSTLAKYDRTKL